jgi:CheY-like chemotaxis protein
MDSITDKITYIFLADDDIEDQDILKNAITQLNPPLVIETVFNGGAAFEYLINCSADKLPSLIILDYKMPILNAVEILERLQLYSQFKRIPKVVWSTSYQEEHIRQCMERGALHYFRKPFNTAELMIIAKEMLAYIPAYIPES